MATAKVSVPAPLPAEVERICAIGNPVLRNLRITECYHRISTAFIVRIGESANWCTFATWASRQAGHTIRGEDMLTGLESTLRHDSFLIHPVQSLWRFLIRRGIFYPETRLGRWVRRLHSPFDAFEKASDAVGRGNHRVFAEIGLEFTRYLAACPPDLPPDSPQFEEFLQTLRPGDPPEGQALLRSAFLLYQGQQFEPDPILRSQAICLANILIGLHEQTRLQPEIQEALESGPEALSTQSRLTQLLRPAMGSFTGLSREIARRVITDSLMVLQLGGVSMQLGRNLDRSMPPQFNPARNPELARLLERFYAEDCGATDWANLDQRMSYIARLFCCFHFDPTLFAAPFTPEQTAEILAGRIPDGRL